MAIDDLFGPGAQRERAAIASRIEMAIERARSHAIGSGSCACAAATLPSVGFAEFQAALIHHIAATYPELDSRSAHSLNELVSRTLGSDELANDKIEQVLVTMLTALRSYAEHCRGFRAEEQN